MVMAMVEPAMNISALKSETRDAIADLYRELDADIAARRPICNTSGRCCKFESWGHRLYVTALELCYFQDLQSADRRNGPKNRSNGVRFPLPLYAGDGAFSPGCPWQVEGLCTARDSRPLGCRVYFCDPLSTTWQQDVYEKYHQKLVKLHEQFEIPYQYLEWREALAQLEQRELMGESI